MIWTKKRELLRNYWSQKSLLSAPTRSIDSRPSCPNANLKMPSQFRNASSNARNRKNTISSRIVALLKTSCPTTVSRLVIPLVIDPIQREIFGAFSHVFQKEEKRIPPLANLNPPSSVNRPPSVFGIPTTLAHRSPTVVSSSVFTTTSVAVLDFSTQNWRRFLRHSIGLFNVVFSSGGRLQPTLTATLGQNP
jgi:hypothetical protein